MSKKSVATLSAGLVAVKGHATAPAADSSPRTPPTAAKETAPKPNEASIPLNFRVPADFQKAFKVYAAKHGLKLNELLRLSFDAYRKEHE